MFPLSDDNPRERTPYITWILIGACVLVYLWQVSLDLDGIEAAIYGFGMIPGRLFGAVELSAEFMVIPAWATVFSSMFMHGGLLHLAGNMLFLWVFGDNVEDSMGHNRFLVFYLACGIAAAMMQAVLNPASTVPMIGASGAISGVLGAYLLLHPYATVRVFIFLGLFATVTRVPAILVLGFWAVGQFISAATTRLDQPGIAFWAHIGGFIAGMALVKLFKRSDVPLFQPQRSKPFSHEAVYRFLG